MITYSVDSYLLDKNNIKKAICTLCKNKKKKPGNKNRKYYEAQRILARLDEYTDMSRIGWLRHCNSKNFYKKHIKKANIKKLKGAIAHASTKRHYATVTI